MQGAAALVAPGKPDVVPATRLRANPWNPNVMDAAMQEKEAASIREFGFVDPLTVREVGFQDFEIIDGEHRWKIGMSLGMTEFPVWNLGLVDDDTARQLTVVLNETRGQPDEGKLSALIKDLLGRRDERQLRTIMPFDKERFDQLIATQKGQVDWDALERKRKAMQASGPDKWVERVFRLPATAAEVLDDAIAKAKEDGETEHAWRALELIAADYISGS